MIGFPERTQDDTKVFTTFIGYTKDKYIEFYFTLNDGITTPIKNAGVKALMKLTPGIHHFFQFKKYVKSVKEKEVFWHYGRERTCKSSVDCDFKTVSVVDMFRHIREAHLNATEGE